ncbi:MAG TPA: cytochrome o ubiquinol oxidase subunit III [Candidatus Saccharimonadales bacterium]|nr:cytochrome o ubiquinol oxidase subunit III [Candidatus Saccharimonadales bacterium]
MTKLLKKATEVEALEDKTHFGFWVYLMTDCILFASLFATYVVLRGNTASGPSGHELFDLPMVLVETLILLTSSFACGLAMLALKRGDKRQLVGWLAATYVLGVAFLVIELNEFAVLVTEGHGWQQSAFLSAFFTLVGTHGVHITIGLLWLLVLVCVLFKRGFSDKLRRQFVLFSLFWHFLDVIWIFIFTIVYLMGAA